MVLLTPTPALISALREYNSLAPEEPIPSDPSPPFLHHRTIGKISAALIAQANGPRNAALYRLNHLLKECAVYIPPKPPKPEPTDEYKSLMARLQARAEAASYRSMLDPTNSTNAMADPYESEDEDDYTYTQLKADMSLIANVLFSIAGTGAAVWSVATGWGIPERVALSFVAGLVVGVAEVVVLAGYYRRIDEARARERARSKWEKKSVYRTWVVGGVGNGEEGAAEDSEEYEEVVEDKEVKME